MEGEKSFSLVMHIVQQPLAVAAGLYTSRVCDVQEPILPELTLVYIYIYNCFGLGGALKHF